VAAARQTRLCQRAHRLVKEGSTCAHLRSGAPYARSVLTTPSEHHRLGGPPSLGTPVPSLRDTPRRPDQAPRRGRHPLMPKGTPATAPIPRPASTHHRATIHSGWGPQSHPPPFASQSSPALSHHAAPAMLTEQFSRGAVSLLRWAPSSASADRFIVDNSVGNVCTLYTITIAYIIHTASAAVTVSNAWPEGTAPCGQMPHYPLPPISHTPSPACRQSAPPQTMVNNCAPFRPSPDVQDCG